jgi:amino acid transporter
MATVELASALPVSGSAYTNAYATMGEVFAWDLILEYGVSVAAVAVGWGSPRCWWCSSSSWSRSRPSTATTSPTSPRTGLRDRDGGGADLLRLHRLRRRLHYILVSVVAVGAPPADQDAPLAVALSEGAGIDLGADIVTFGALVAITSVVLTILYGQTRVAYSMCRDGLLPARLGAVWEKTRTAVLLTLAFAVPVALLAAFVPLEEIAELVNIGTLFFFVGNLAVIWLRRTKPEMERGFRVPLVPVPPLIGAALCVYLMAKLPVETWLRFALGVVIYVGFGFRNSRLRSGAGAA